MAASRYATIQDTGSLADIGLEGASDTDIAHTGTERSHGVGNAQVDYRQFTHYEAGMLDEARATINNNTSLSPEERFEQLNRLNALACAEVRCAAGVSENDDFYDILTDLQREGEALKEEQGTDILQTLAALDVDTTYVTRSGRSSNEHDGFQYGVGDATNDIISDHEQIVARGVQAGQVVAGTLEVAGATGLCTTGVGCTVGAALGTVGAVTLAEGMDGLSKEHDYQSGERVVDSFSLEGHQGNYNPTADAVAEVLVNVAGGAAGRVAGRLGDDVVEALPSSNNPDVRLEGNAGDSLGARADAELGELPERSVIPRREPEVDQAAKNPSSDAEELSRNQLYPEAESPEINTQHLDLVTSHPNAHSLTRHGGDVTDEQLRHRALTGEAPDGHVKIDRRSGRPVVPPISSAFHSDKLLIETDQRIRNSSAFKDKVNQLPEGADTITLGPGDLGDLGQNLGRGYRRLGGSRLNPETQGAPQKLNNLNSAQGTWKRNSETGEWETITLFPVKAP
ncbi:hypothetical protein [Marinibactrum halimedae]|uniref:Uncharacterized protein n=1 Tax=Marinibactrum halimedae TaxID=1444977 RepID=A0AA37T638_9GAMM|nr:hypothetical protein [Marinibactrum halimedae]MCD9461268.1 hypothetical protein [Marinibactrum halimedae]GLS25903.1 hypothetical protein GCM10007877_16170 [Marinibactrum halimedae]